MDIQNVVKVFGMYLGYKLHFTNENFIYTDSFLDRYDENSLNGRKKDIDLFIQLGSTYGERIDELKERLITLFMISKRGYIIDLFGSNDKFEKTHFERMRNVSNLTNVIENDLTDFCDYMDTHNLKLDQMLDFNGDRPLLVKKLKLSNEFISLLDGEFDFLKQETDNPLWNKRKFTLQKYKSFLHQNERISNLFGFLSDKYK